MIIIILSSNKLKKIYIKDIERNIERIINVEN